MLLENYMAKLSKAGYYLKSFTPDGMTEGEMPKFGVCCDDDWDNSPPMEFWEIPPIPPIDYMNAIMHNQKWAVRCLFCDKMAYENPCEHCGEIKKGKK
jgi:hypothetical protein